MGQISTIDTFSHRSYSGHLKINEKGGGGNIFQLKEKSFDVTALGWGPHEIKLGNWLFRDAANRSVSIFHTSEIKKNVFVINRQSLALTSALDSRSAIMFARKMDCFYRNISRLAPSGNGFGRGCESDWSRFIAFIHETDGRRVTKKYSNLQCPTL